MYLPLAWNREDRRFDVEYLFPGLVTQSTVAELYVGALWSERKPKGVVEELLEVFAHALIVGVKPYPIGLQIPCSIDGLNGRKNSLAKLSF